MRIVVSGTHASGKSTLVADFCTLHPEYAHLPDPFELLDDFRDQPDASSFLSQLALSARRLEDIAPDTDVVAERGPLDFLAYLIAWEDSAMTSRTRPCGGPPTSPDRRWSASTSSCSCR